MDVEKRGQYTRGETVANRQGFVDKETWYHSPNGDHFVVDGIEKVTPNVKVATEVNSEKFVAMFLSAFKENDSRPRPKFRPGAAPSVF